MTLFYIVFVLLPVRAPPPLIAPSTLTFRSGFQRYWGHNGKARTQDGQDDAGGTGRGPRAGNEHVLRLPDGQGDQGKLQTGSSSRRRRHGQEGLLTILREPYKYDTAL